MWSRNQPAGINSLANQNSLLRSSNVIPNTHFQLDKRFEHLFPFKKSPMSYFFQLSRIHCLYAITHYALEINIRFGESSEFTFLNEFSSFRFFRNSSRLHIFTFRSFLRFLFFSHYLLLFLSNTSPALICV